MPCQTVPASEIFVNQHPCGLAVRRRRRGPSEPTSRLDAVQAADVHLQGCFAACRHHLTFITAEGLILACPTTEVNPDDLPPTAKDRILDTTSGSCLVPGPLPEHPDATSHAMGED